MRRFKIFFIIVLTLTGLSTYGKADDQCFIEGQYSVLIEKDFNFSNTVKLSGFINSSYKTTYVTFDTNYDHTDGNIDYYNATVSYQGEWLNLVLTYDENNSRFDLTGTIHGQFIDWYTPGNWIAGVQPCIL